MKTTLLSNLCAGALILLLAACCKQQAEQSNNNIRFNSLSAAETYYLENDTAKPACNIQITFMYPDSADAQLLNKLQGLFLEKMFGDTFKSLHPQQALDEYVRQYIAGFQQFATQPADTLSFYSEEEDIQYRDETGFTCYTHLSDTILYNQNGFISFLVQSRVYEGGARDAKNTNAYVIHLPDGEFLNEEQFSGENYRNHISNILVKKIAEANGLKDAGELENLGYNSLSEIVPNQNFTIDSHGITYYFNEGEIAGISVGIVRVFIPYRELRECIAGDSPLSLFVNK